MATRRFAPAARLRLAWAVWLAELCLMPLSNNVVAFITWQTRSHLDLYPVLAAGLYSYIGARHLNILPFGFRWSWRNTGIAAAAGALLALPALMFLVHPVVVQHVDYGPVTALSVNGLLHRLLVDLPVLTALVEEFVFRHWLYFETSSLLKTVLINSALFTVWHGVAGFTAAQATHIGHSLLEVFTTYAGALAAVFVGGIVFALVRHKTGSFVYSALTHWLSDAVIVLAIWGTAPGR